MTLRVLDLFSGIGAEFYEDCEHCECVDFGEDDDIDEQIWEPGGGSYTTRIPRKGPASPELQEVLRDALAQVEDGSKHTNDGED